MFLELIMLVFCLDGAKGQLSITPSGIVDVTEKSRFTIACSYIGSSFYNLVYWSKNGATVYTLIATDCRSIDHTFDPTIVEATCTNSGKDFTLTFIQVKKDQDEERWSCKVDTLPETSSAEVTIKIKVQVTSVQLQKNDNTINTDTVELDADVPTRFECNVIPSTSRPPPTVIWYIGSTVQQNSTNTSYTVTATETDHDKIIYCKAYNLQPESQAVESVKPKLYVRVMVYSVTLVYENNEPGTGEIIYVTAGTNAVMTCTPGTSRPAPTIVWYIGTTIKQTSPNTVFNLNAVDADHDKAIYCKAYNLQGLTQAVFSSRPKLYVQVQVSALTLKHNSHQLATGEILKVTAGRPETLICEPGHSRPTPTIDWYIKDDTNKKQSAMITTHNLNASNEDHDQEIYCKAYNLQVESSGVMSTKPKLYVRVLAAIPSFLNSLTNGFTLLNGDTYSIQCQSTPTRPAAVITWKIGNVPLTTTETGEVIGSRGLVSVISTLSLYAQKSYHNSEIICESKVTEQHYTPETKALLIIWWRPSKPSIQTINGDFPWVEGGQGELTCFSTDYGNPTANIIWTQNIGTMNAENRLVIDTLTYLDHRRTVKCRMENEFTEEKTENVESDEILLNVQFSPQFLTTDVIFVGKIERNINITFRVYCNPKDVTAKLFVNGSVTNDNEKYVLMITEGVSEELNLTIRIMDLDKSDLANYSLDVTNSIDTTEVNFSITADSIPHKPTAFRLKELRGSIAIFYWESGFNGGNKQIFLLQMMRDDEGSWRNSTIIKEHDINSNLGNSSYIANINTLKPGTYDVRLIAMNVIGAAEPVLLGTRFTVPSKAEAIANCSVAAIAGGVSAGFLVIIVIVAAVVILKYLRQKGFLAKKKNESLQQEHGPDYYNMSAKEKGKEVHTMGSTPNVHSLKTENYEDLSQIRGNSSDHDNIGASFHADHDSRNEESTYEGLKPSLATQQTYSSLKQEKQTNSEMTDSLYTNLKLN